MAEYPINQTAPRRAWADTQHFRNSNKWFWGIEVVGAVIFGLSGTFGGYFLTPQDATQFKQFSYPAIAGSIGIILGFIIVFGFIYIWNLFRAPYRQRNEARSLLLVKPKPIPLSNKDDLIRALQKVAQSSCEVFIIKERIANSQKVSPNLVNTELITELNNAESSLHEKNKDLDAELAVAGQKYRECISDVTNFISAQLQPSVEGVLNNRDYQEKLRLKMNETIQRIQD